MEKQTKHTPGPWKIAAAQYTKSGNVAIVADDKLADKHEGWVYVCDMNTHRTAEADARLIASSPDLLAALEAIVKKLNEKSLDGAKRRAASEEIALAALTKARGQ